MKLKPKQCCNNNCTNVFLIEPYKFYQKDLCDKCIERNRNKKLNMINKNKISAQIVADSIDDKGNRITSFLVVFPRMILAEINTHRMFTKSTSSSRAVPFNKMIEVVEKESFIPIAWQKVHKGMQGTEYLGEEYSKSALNNWLKARDFAVTQAKHLNSDSQVTKQLCNRLLEPFMWTTMLLTTSEEGLQNFFNLRCPRYKINGAEDYYMSKYEAMKFNKATHNFTQLDWLKHNEGQAEIHMMDLAEKMYDAFTTNTPKKLKSNEWHIPFREKIIGSYGQLSDNNLVKISVAMSAHTSYTTIEGAKKRKIGDWIGLFGRLIKQDPPHSSPMEHCCVCVSEKDYKKSYKGSEEGWFRNYKGFKSYRQIIEEEKL